MADKPKDSEEIEWNAAVEILFLYAMVGHKPVGVNRYFMMACIHDKFSNYMNRQITSKVIWDHLDSMYGMAALHESEIIPFPNEEREFELPADEFESLKKEKLEAVAVQAQSESNTEAKKEVPKIGRKSNAAKPKLIQVNLNQGKEKDSVSGKSSPATTPVSVKVNKTAVSVKSEQNSNSNTTESSSLKVKAESSVQGKTTKPKSTVAPQPRKPNKTETPLSPQVKVQPSLDALLKKTKAEASSGKKSAKQEKEKSEISESKKSKEVTTGGKKASAVNYSSGNRRNSKGDSSSLKKRSESETPSKKGADGPSKQLKVDKSPQGAPAKGIKVEKADESDSQNSISAGKLARSQPKTDSVESGVKKRKRSTKAEETPSPKKNQVGNKRRRT